MKDLQKSNKMSIYSKIILHLPFPAIITLLVINGCGFLFRNKNETNFWKRSTEIILCRPQV